MNRSTPGLPVHHQPPEFTQTHVHQVSDAIQPSHPAVPFSSCPQSFPASGSFPMSQLFTSGGQSIDGASPSASVLPISIQGWFPLGLDWFALLVVQGTLKSVLQDRNWEHQFFDAHLHGPILTLVQDYWKNHSFDYMDLCQQSDVSAFSERVKIGVR